MSIQVNRITNANIYLEGGSILGQAKEIDVPEIKFTMSEHVALGLVGKMEFFSGIDKLEMKVRWNSFYKDTLMKFGNPFNPLQMQIRASSEEYSAQGRGSEKPVVIHLTAHSKNFPNANFKQHDNVEAESTLGVTYYKMVIDGVEVVEIDVLANIYKVNGVDMLANYRANIGG